MPPREVHLRIDDARLQAAIAAFPEKMEQAAEGAITLAGAELAREVVVRTPVAHGFLANAVDHEFRGKDDEGVFRGAVFVNPPADRYALPVETGRKPGKAPPPDAILLWLQAPKMKAAVQILATDIQARRQAAQARRKTTRKYKLSEEEAAERQLAFLIGRAIARRGTEGAKMFERAIEENADRLLTFLREQMLAAAAAAWEGN